MPTAQSLTRNIDRELAYTDEHLIPGVKHISFQHSPVALIFLGDASDPQNGGGQLRGSGHRTQGGGQKVQVNHSVANNSTAQAMAGPWDSYDTTPQDNVRRSEANWKHYSATRTVNLFDSLINRGPDAVADLVTDLTFNTMGSLIEVVAQDVISGSGTGVTGIRSLIGANDSVQGMSGATYSKWNSRGVSARETAAASVTFASGSFAAQGITDFRIAFDNASEGMRKPNVIITGYTERQYYEGALVPQERYAAPARTGDASFMNLLFRDAPVIADPFTTSGEAYFINTDTLYYKALEGGDFDFQEWKHALDQEARTSELVAKGQMCIEDRRLNNKLTTISA